MRQPPPIKSSNTTLLLIGRHRRNFPVHFADARATHSDADAPFAPNSTLSMTIVSSPLLGPHQAMGAKLTSGAAIETPVLGSRIDAVCDIEVLQTSATAEFKAHLSVHAA